MVNKRSKIKKTQNTLKTTCISQASIAESDRQFTQSGALIGSNDDLLTRILHRLPVISILRFKSVSKHWLSLLSHQQFTHLYDKFWVSPGLFVRNMYIPFDEENRSPPPFRILKFSPDRRGVKIVQSCNGLLLCCNNKGKEHTRKYYVFNPTTKQFAVIPSVIGGPSVSKTIFYMGMAFHQTECVHYKIVCIYSANSNPNRYPDQRALGIQIYSSDTGTWKISNQSFFGYCFNIYGRQIEIEYGVYWNGAIHWAPSWLDPVYFKLDVEQLENLLTPGKVQWPGSRYNVRPLYFGESRGHLHFVETTRYEDHSQLNVYEMLVDHSGWFVKYQVELHEIHVAYPEIIRSNQYPSKYHYEVFDVVRGEEEDDDAFMVVRVPGKIIRFNLLNKSFKQIFDLPNILFLKTIGHADVHRYTELISYF